MGRLGRYDALRALELPFIAILAAVAALCEGFKHPQRFQTPPGSSRRMNAVLPFQPIGRRLIRAPREALAQEPVGVGVFAQGKITDSPNLNCHSLPPGGGSISP